MIEPFNLDRFTSAQRPVWEEVVAELRAGRRRTHWTAFVFPQLAGTGSGPLAPRFGIRSLDEARAYAAHTVLGPRLIEAATLATAMRGDARRLFGHRDARNLHASMTLFAGIADDPGVFAEVLHHFFRGVGEHRTLQRLADER